MAFKRSGVRLPLAPPRKEERAQRAPFFSALRIRSARHPRHERRAQRAPSLSALRTSAWRPLWLPNGRNDASLGKYLSKSKNGTASAVLFSWRKKFGACLDARRDAALFYGNEFPRTPFARQRKNLPSICFMPSRRFKTIMTNCKQICNTSRKKEDIMNTENRGMRKNFVMPLSETMLHAAV